MTRKIIYPKLVVFLLILIVLIIKNVAPSNFPKICPKPIRACYVGQYMKTADGKVLYENYLGIPYAKPPIGALRYKRPVKYEYENSCTAYLTLVDRPPCAHYAFQHQDEPYGNEDCLYLNVYKPVSLEHSEQLLPVLIEFADQDFEKGDASSGKYGAELLMTYGEMVVVTVNTRLSVFGYLFSQTQQNKYDGNMGLFDHLMALQWVHDNIQYFGGNSSRITIAGEASVSYLILNKEAQPMIDKAIIRYTTFISEYNRPYENSFHGKQPEHTFDSRKQAFLNIMLATDTSSSFLSKNASSLLKIIYNEHSRFRIFPVFRFKPIADYQFDIGIEKPFLWAHPFTLWSNPNHTFTKPVCLIRLKLPFFDMALKLMEEGYGVLNRQVSATDLYLTKTRVTLLESLFLSYKWDDMLLLESIHKHYYGTNSTDEVSNLKIDNKNVLQLLQFLSGALFDYPLIRLMHSRPQTLFPTTLFIALTHNAFNMRSAQSLYLPTTDHNAQIPNFAGNYEEVGARGDDQCFMYTQTSYARPPLKDDIKLSDKWISIMVEFMENGTFWYDNNKKRVNCEIYGTIGAYDFETCFMLYVEMKNDGPHVDVAYPFKNSPFPTPYILWDYFFHYDKFGERYEWRDVIKPN